MIEYFGAFRPETTDDVQSRATKRITAEAGDVPVVPLILSGGAGTRLWPLSRRFEPKQFARLTGDRTPFQETLIRFGAPCFAAPIIVANGDQEPMLRHDADAIATAADKRPTVMLEPSIRSTAAPIACAALMLAERGQAKAIVMVTPSDHKVSRPDELYEAIAGALAFVRSGSIALFGIDPTRPETGFGYIRVGPMEHGVVRRVVGFVEKPDARTAERYLESGSYLWNSGMFLFEVRTMLEELERHVPDILAIAGRALREGKWRNRWVRLGRSFDASPSEAIDTAVMERSTRLGVVPISPGWSDLGTFHALWQEGEKDDAGNVVTGPSLLDGVSNSYIRADKRRVCVYGLSDICVVDTADAILIGPHAETDAIKGFVNTLSKANDDAALRHPAPAWPENDGETLRIDIEPESSVVVPGAVGGSRLISIVAGSLKLKSCNSITRLGCGDAAHLMDDEPVTLTNENTIAAQAIVFRFHSLRHVGYPAAPQNASIVNGLC